MSTILESSFPATVRGKKRTNIQLFQISENRSESVIGFEEKHKIHFLKNKIKDHLLIVTELFNYNSCKLIIFTAK